MDFKVNYETIPLTETVFSGTQEQSVELEYILPDYFPDIFKLIKCRAVPRIVSKNIGNDKVVYEISVDINVIYQSESSGVPNCINQRLSYTKTLEFGKSCENADITLIPKIDYINCRAVNQRRLDIRGAVSIKADILCSSAQEIICDAFGMNIQLKKVPVEYISKKITAEKSVSVNEDLELNSAKPSVSAIIRSDVSLAENEKKVIANKLVAKGEAVIDILYSYDNENGNGMESMQFTIPYSQIIDAEGIDESFECIVCPEVMCCDISLSPDSKGENRIFKCDLIINVSCKAFKTAVTEIVSDAYSTSFLCECVSSPVKSEHMPISKKEMIQSKSVAEYGDGNIESVLDVCCNTANVNIRINPSANEIFLTGTVQYSVMIKNDSGTIVFIEKDEIFEHTMKYEEIGINSIVTADIKPISCSYTLTADNKIALKSDLQINCVIKNSDTFNALTEILPDDTSIKQRDGDYALKLYYGVENEDIWSIAKRYNTSVSAIMEENELDSERLKSNGMILIPITG